jgi:hypothetical protein
LTSNGFGDNIDFSKQRKNSILIGGEDRIKRYHQMVTSQSNGSASKNGTTSTTERIPSNNGTKNNTAGAKPRRNTIMAVNGQFPHNNGL